jgi:GNAT superfamily N-acetyltransferase
MTNPDLDLMILSHLNLAEFSRELARWSGPAGAITESDGVFCFASGSSLPVLLNGAQRLDPWVDPERLLHTADEWFGARGRSYTIFTPVHETDLAEMCEKNGLPVVAEPPELVCETVPDARPLPPGCELRWVDDEAGMHAAADINGDAYSTYGMPTNAFAEVARDARRFCAPHVHTVLAYDNGAPAATAQIVMSHGIGGVFAVGTREANRGKGLGDAVARAVTRRAFELGAPFVSLQASPMGDPIYRRMGYRELYGYRFYLRMLPA